MVPTRSGDGDGTERGRWPGDRIAADGGAQKVPRSGGDDGGTGGPTGPGGSNRPVPGSVGVADGPFRATLILPVRGGTSTGMKQALSRRPSRTTVSRSGRSTPKRNSIPTVSGLGPAAPRLLDFSAAPRVRRRSRVRRRLRANANPFGDDVHARPTPPRPAYSPAACSACPAARSPPRRSPCRAGRSPRRRRRAGPGSPGAGSRRRPPS